MNNSDRILTIPNAVLALLGLLGVADFPLLGRVPINEFLCLCIGPFLTYSILGNRDQRKLCHVFIVLCFLWLLGGAIADAGNNNTTENAIKAAARVTVFFFTVASLFYLCSLNRKAVFVLLIATGVGEGLRAILFPSDFVMIDAWKFGFSSSVNYVLLIAGVMAWSRLPLLAIVILMGGCLLNLALGLRSTSIVFFIVLALTLAALLFARFKANSRAVSAVGMLLAGVIAAYTFSEAYGFLASSGYLGDVAETKYAIQARRGSDPISLLLSGRSEWRIFVEAIKAKPFLGHGAWTENPEYLAYIVDDTQDTSQLDMYSRQMTVGSIPTHSFIFGAWVEAGILGGIVWTVILAFIVKRLYMTTLEVGFYAIIIRFCGINLVWNIFFSPFGTGARFSAAVWMVAVALSVSYTFRPVLPTRQRALRKTVPHSEGRFSPA